MSREDLLVMRDYLWENGMLTRAGLEYFDLLLDVDTRKRNVEQGLCMTPTT